MKPSRSSFGRGIQKFEDWSSLAAFFEENNPNNNGFILQPFIVGSDITCNVICKDGRIIRHTIQESPVKTGSDFSSNDILEFHEDEQVIEVIAKMMALLNWWGCLCGYASGQQGPVS